MGGMSGSGSSGLPKARRPSIRHLMELEVESAQVDSDSSDEASPHGPPGPASSQSPSTSGMSPIALKVSGKLSGPSRRASVQSTASAEKRRTPATKGATMDFDSHGRAHYNSKEALVRARFMSLPLRDPASPRATHELGWHSSLEDASPGAASRVTKTLPSPGSGQVGLWKRRNSYSKALSFHADDIRVASRFYGKAEESSPSEAQKSILGRKGVESMNTNPSSHKPTVLPCVAAGALFKATIIVMPLECSRGMDDRNTDHAWACLVDECTILKSIKHPAVVEITSMETSSSAVRAVRLVEEELVSIRHYYETEEVPEPRACLTWVLSLMAGLDHLHNGLGLPIIHRNISPDTICLSRHLQVKIADFSHCVFDMHDGMTFKPFFGDPRYTACELAPLLRESAPLLRESAPLLRVPECTRAGDVFSAGMATYFICTGEEPFAAESDPERVTTMIYQGERPDARNPKVQSVCRNLVHVLSCMWDHCSIERPLAEHLVSMIVDPEPLVRTGHSQYRGMSSSKQRIADLLTVHAYNLVSNEVRKLHCR